MRREKIASGDRVGRKQKPPVRAPRAAVPSAIPVILGAPRPAKKCVSLANLRGARRTGIV
jgi:hypothetical protein